MIPLCDVQLQYQGLKSELDAALTAAAAAGRYILGPNVKAFEQEFADYCGSQFAAGVGNGTDALTLSLRALEIGPGDEVITTPFTFIATAEAISLVGATPVFVDVDAETFNIDPSLIESAVTERTRAILPVHLYGQPCDMDPILAIAKEHDLAVVEDCAQAVGATYKGRRVGTFGDAGCFSFFPSKNLGCMGDGGMVVSNRPEIHERVEMLRRHGGRVKYHHEEVGVNSRLDELQAAVLRVKLSHLNEWNRLRRENAWRYNELLSEVADVRVPLERAAGGKAAPGAPAKYAADHLSCVYHQYTLLSSARDPVVAALKEHEVGCLVYYPVPLHQQQVYAGLGHKAGDFPAAEDAARRCFSIPMFPELTEAQQTRVAACLKDALATPAARFAA